MKSRNIKTILSATTLIAILFSSCSKFLDIDAPITSTNQENVYKNDYTASAVITGLYAQIMNGFSSGGVTSISLLQELAGDNLVLANTNLTNYLNIWRNSLTADYINNGGYNNYFTNFYPKIYIINAAIEGSTSSNSLSPKVKKRILGEAYFLRAFYYFYLTNLFGDVPLILKTDYSQNSTQPRAPSSTIYQQMISDLKQSITLLDNDYVDASLIASTPERIRPNLSAAQSLLARVYLYNKNYVEAEKNATEVINRKTTYSIVGLDSVFLKNSAETIWALQPVKQGYNTDEGAVFLLTGIPGILNNKFCYLSKSLMSSFENNDKRNIAWTNTFNSGTAQYPFSTKYKTDVNVSGGTDIKEYCIVLRLSEQYLIRAESRLEQNNIQEAVNDINVIRTRAGLNPINIMPVSDLRKYILHERRVELFTEWGHRWFDLKRTGNIDQTMISAMSYKGGNWASFKSLYPIPNSEIVLNKNLSQNQGY